MRKKIISFFKTVRYCMALSWKVSKVYTILRMTIFIIIMVLPYSSMYITKALLDLLTSKDNIFLGDAIICVCAIVSITVGIKILNQLQLYCENIHSEKIIFDINRVVMRKTMKTNIEFYDSPAYLDMVQAIMSDSYSLNNITWNIFLGISNFVALIISLIMISAYNLGYALLLIIVSIPSVLVSKYFSKKLYQWRIDNLSFERQYNYVHSISNDRYFAFDVRAHNLIDFFLQRYKRYWDICFSGRLKLRKKKLMLTIPTIILPEIFILLFIIKLIGGILSGENSIGDFTLYMGLYTSLMGATETVISSLTAVYEDKLKVDTVSEFDSYGEEEERSGKLLLENGFDVEFKNVSFRYPKSDRYVLKNISFQIKKNTRLCILGVNGSGKSTIIKLLMRYYDVTEGEILINSINIKQYSLISLRRNFSVVFQDYINYAFTLRENIQTTDIDKGKLDDDEVKRIMESVYAQELLEKLSQGADTYLQRIFDKYGYEPSGGERQKVALARAINRDCKVLILDEPTAALDPESESNLFNNIKNQFSDKTIIFTSHRLSTVHLADNIILVENGRIIEEGNHAQLMKLNKKYAKLYNLQSNNYK